MNPRNLTTMKRGKPYWSADIQGTKTHLIIDVRRMVAHGKRDFEMSRSAFSFRKKRILKLLAK